MRERKHEIGKRLFDFVRLRRENGIVVGRQRFRDKDIREKNIVIEYDGADYRFCWVEVFAGHKGLNSYVERRLITEEKMRELEGKGVKVKFVKHI